MAAAATYEQHVFGLELNDKYLGTLNKTAKVLEKLTATWDKLEARISGGGLNKAMERVNGLIGRFGELEKTIERVQGKARTFNVGGGSGGARGGGVGGGSVMNSHDARRKYETWWESQMKRQETTEARALQRKEDAQQKAFEKLRLDAAKASERATKQQEAAQAPFANMWARIGMKMQQQQFADAQKKSAELKKDMKEIAGYLTSALDLLKQGVVGALSSAFEWGKKIVHTLVDAAKERGLLMTALEIQLGDRDKASRQLNKTIDIAQLTPASNMQVIDLTKRMLGQQFRGQRLDAARAAWADVQAFGGDKSARQIEFWMSRTAARGEASTAAVSGIAKAGISERFIREEMAKRLGKSVGYKEGGPYTDKIDKAVRDAVSDRKVSSSVFETSVERAILRTLKQTELGAYAKKKGVESLAGVLSNVEEAVPSFLMRLNIDEFSGIKELKRFLSDLLSFFNLGTKEGKVLAGIVEDLTNELLGGLKNITKDDMARFFYLAADAAKELVKVIGQAWDLLGQLISDTQGKGLGGVLEAAGKIFGTAVGEAIAAMLPSILQGFVAALPGALKGVAVGAAEGAWSLGTDLGHGAKKWMNNTSVGKWFNGSVLGRSSSSSSESSASDAIGLAAERGRQRALRDGLPADEPLMSVDVPSHAGGGEVPGPSGKPRLIVAHGKERVFPPGKGGGAGMYVENLYVQCDDSAMRMRFDEWLLEAVEDASAQGDGNG